MNIFVFGCSAAALLQQNKPKNVTTTTTTIACNQPATVAAAKLSVIATSTTAEAVAVTIKSDEATELLNQQQRHNVELRNLYTLPLVKRKKARNATETPTKTTETTTITRAVATTGKRNTIACRIFRTTATMIS